MSHRGPRKDVRDKSRREVDHSPTEHIVYGLNAVVEAIRAGKRSIDSITILNSARPERIKSLLALARQNRIPVHRVPKLDLGADARGTSGGGEAPADRRVVRGPRLPDGLVGRATGGRRGPPLRAAARRHRSRRGGRLHPRRR